MHGKREREGGKEGLPVEASIPCCCTRLCSCGCLAHHLKLSQFRQAAEAERSGFPPQRVLCKGDPGKGADLMEMSIGAHGFDPTSWCEKLRCVSPLYSCTCSLRTSSYAGRSKRCTKRKTTLALVALVAVVGRRFCLAAKLHTTGPNSAWHGCASGGTYLLHV